MQAALSSLDYTVGKNSLKKVQLRGDIKTSLEQRNVLNTTVPALDKNTVGKKCKKSAIINA